jgi:hypothetical protein
VQPADDDEDPDFTVLPDETEPEDELDPDPDE